MTSAKMIWRSSNCQYKGASHVSWSIPGVNVCHKKNSKTKRPQWFLLKVAIELVDVERNPANCELTKDLIEQE
jgi:hypothetical protein